MESKSMDGDETIHAEDEQNRQNAITAPGRMWNKITIGEEEMTQRKAMTIRYDETVKQMKRDCKTVGRQYVTECANCTCCVTYCCCCLTE